MDTLVANMQTEQETYAALPVRPVAAAKQVERQQKVGRAHDEAGAALYWQSQLDVGGCVLRWPDSILNCRRPLTANQAFNHDNAVACSISFVAFFMRAIARFIRMSA